MPGRLYPAAAGGSRRRRRADRYPPRLVGRIRTAAEPGNREICRQRDAAAGRAAPARRSRDLLPRAGPSRYRGRRAVPRAGAAGARRVRVDRHDAELRAVAGSALRHARGARTWRSETGAAQRRPHPRPRGDRLHAVRARPRRLATRGRLAARGSRDRSGHGAECPARGQGHSGALHTVPELSHRRPAHERAALAHVHELVPERPRRHHALLFQPRTELRRHRAAALHERSRHHDRRGAALPESLELLGHQRRHPAQ